MRTKKLSASEILSKHRKSWGPSRKFFEVSVEEMRILALEGGTHIVKNMENGDGTFYNKLLFDDLVFESSSVEKV